MNFYLTGRTQEEGDMFHVYF